MEAVLVIVLLVFVFVGISFLVGRYSKEHEMNMENIIKEQAAKDEANKTNQSVNSADINDIRDELRDEASK